MSGAPQTVVDPRLDRATPIKLGSWGRILLNSGDDLLRDSGNGSGQELGSSLSLRVFFFLYGLGLSIFL